MYIFQKSTLYNHCVWPQKITEHSLSKVDGRGQNAKKILCRLVTMLETAAAANAAAATLAAAAAPAAATDPKATS
jgi:hypothetical protein